MQQAIQDTYRTPRLDCKDLNQEGLVRRLYSLSYPASNFAKTSLLVHVDCSPFIPDLSIIALIVKMKVYHSRVASYLFDVGIVEI